MLTPEMTRSFRTWEEVIQAVQLPSKEASCVSCKCSIGVLPQRRSEKIFDQISKTVSTTCQTYSKNIPRIRKKIQNIIAKAS